MTASVKSRARSVGIATRTQVHLDGHRLLTLSVRAGDALGSDAGIVWITIDNEPGLGRTMLSAATHGDEEHATWLADLGSVPNAPGNDDRRATLKWNFLKSG